jgi:hypothetical protein
MRDANQPVHILRDAIVRSNALRFYATAWDHWSTEEQLKRAEGQVVEAEGAHQFALMLIRAYRNELDDPEPKPQ